jgi:hypothetical protein
MGMLKAALFVAILLAGVKVGKDVAAKFAGGAVSPGI